MYSCCCHPAYWGPFLPIGVLVNIPLDDDNKKNNGEEHRCIGWNKKNDTPKSHEFRILTYKFLKFCAWRNFNLKLRNSFLLAWGPRRLCQKILNQSLFSKILGNLESQNSKKWISSQNFNLIPMYGIGLMYQRNQEGNPFLTNIWHGMYCQLSLHTPGIPSTPTYVIPILPEACWITQ